MKKLLGIKCPRCKEFISSLHRHDFKVCSCGTTFIDGGQNNSYVRYGYLKDNKFTKNPLNVEHSCPQTETATKKRPARKRPNMTKKSKYSVLYDKIRNVIKAYLGR